MEPLAAWVTTKFPELGNVTPMTPGGQKWVFGATHPTYGEVVLKIIKPSQDPEGVAREIRAVLEVASPRVPRIHDHGRADSDLGDCIWVLEDRVAGTTLKEHLTNGNALTADESIDLGRQMLDALVIAEYRKIVHRDIKPGNIMRAGSSDFWLLDFGISRHLTLPSQTPSLSPFGKFTPGYAPPEQFRNLKAEIDTRADLFALGVTLYESMTGSNPFTKGAPNDLEILNRVEGMVLPRLTAESPSGQELADLIQTMTQKRRDQRPPSASKALAWLSEIRDANERE